MAVESVALKLPLFWTSCPIAWFAQIEAQFSIRNITADDTKYYYVVSAGFPTYREQIPGHQGIPNIGI